MTNQTTGSLPTPRSRGRRVGILALLLITAAGGVYAGARWHKSVAPMLGMKAAGGTAQADGAGEAGNARQLWTCGMHPQVIQDHPGDCPICHMKLTPLKMDSGVAGDDQGAMTNSESAATATDGQERRIKYWWDPMLSPPYISDKPGKSPMGMDLIPVYEDEATATGAPGPVVIDPAVVQNMGVRIALVTEGPLQKSLRLVGYLDEAQPNIHDVNLRISGWIRRLHASAEGMHVEAGDPLFDLYSPELQVAIEELIAARRARTPLASGADSQGIEATLADAAIQKLELVGLPRAQIDALAKLDRAPETVTFTSPITGYVTEKPIVEGAAVKMGDRALRIVDYSTLWLDAQVFERDLPFVKVGQSAQATVASRPNEPLRGEIIFMNPRVDAMTRTAMVRLSIPNPTLALKPGMYATVRTQSQVAERAVLVPREAIIDTGEKQMAFVALAVGRFQPRQVKIGLAGEDGMVQVVEGLAPGEAVVTSGQFLIDSESRLREAIQKFLNEKNQAAAPPMSPPAPSPASPTRTATTTLPMFEATPAQGEMLDAVVTAYLAISDALGAVQKNTTSLDMTKLIAAAHVLHGAVSGTTIEPLAVGVAKAAEAMKGHPIDHQRSMFSSLGEKVIALVDALPPSTAVAKTLYVMNCPMAPGGAKGDWLQTSPDVANPFFAAEMKECGSQVRTIPLREAPR